MKDLKEKFYRFFKDNPLIIKILPFFIIVFIVIGFFWKVVFLNYVPLPGDFVVGVYYPWLDYKWGFPAGVPVKNPITTDVVSFIYPMRTLAVDLLKKGQLPLWNPYILTGSPLLANFQSAPFTITNIFYFIFDKITAWSFQIITQHILAAFFMYLLLRHWKISRLSSLLGGIVYAFSGFNLIWSQWNAHTLTAGFLPLILLFSDKYLKGGELRFGIALSFSLLFQILSGYPQVVMYTFVALSILWIIRATKKPKFILKTLLWCSFLLIGFGLASFQLLPGAELLKLSQRAIEPHPYEWAFLPWVKTITFLAPDYFGNHATKNYWGPQDYTSNTGFVGVGALILASFSYYWFKSKREVKLACLLVLASLVLAYPTPVSIFVWRSGIFGLQAASAHRALVLFNFGVAILSGFGAEIIKRRFHKLNYPPTILVPFIILFSFAGYTVFNYILSKLQPEKYISTINNVSFHIVALRNLVIPVGLFVLMFVLMIIWKKYKFSSYILILFFFTIIIFELFRFGYKFTPFSPRGLVYPMTPVLNFLTHQEKPYRVTGIRVIPMNMRMAYNLESPEGYDAVYSKDIAQFLASLSSSNIKATTAGRYGFIDKEDSHLVDLMNTKYQLVLKRDQFGRASKEGKIPPYYLKDKYKVAFEDKTVVVLENINALPRASVVYDWEVLEDKKLILEKLLNPNFLEGNKVLLEEHIIYKQEAGTGNNKVKYLKYEEQESVLRVETDKGGLLFISDLYYPGWKAFIDNDETKIYKANYAFRAVYVPKGEHNIKFVYRPDSFKKGLIISIISLLVLLIIPFTTILGKKRN